MFNFGMIPTTNKYNKQQSIIFLQMLLYTLNFRQWLLKLISLSIFQSSFQLTCSWESIPRKTCNIILNALFLNIPYSSLEYIVEHRVTSKHDETNMIFWLLYDKCFRKKEVKLNPKAQYRSWISNDIRKLSKKTLRPYE